METVTGRERIVQAAAARFLDHGFAATTLRDIAADVGIRAGSIYYHFESKDALLREILTAGIAAMDEAFDEVAEATAEASPGERVRAHVAAHLSVLFERGPVTAAHVTAFRTLPDEVRADLIPARDGYEQRWAGLLAELRDEGHLAADLDLTLLRLTLLGAMNFAVEWFDPDRANLDELVEVVTRQFWTGASAATAAAPGTATDTSRSAA